MVILVALGVSFIMLTKVIPEFDKMFVGFGAELPWFTRQVLDLSAWTQNWSPFIALGSISVFISARVLSMRSDSFRLMLNALCLSFQSLGQFYRKPLSQNLVEPSLRALRRAFRF